MTTLGRLLARLVSLEEWRTPKPLFLALGAVALACLLLSITSALQKSVTIDEFSSYPNGFVIWKTGRFDIDHGTTPLSKILTAIPLLFTQARFDTSNTEAMRSVWGCGRQFATDNLENYHLCFTLGRMVSILFLLVVSMLASGYARSLYGNTAALVAAVFTCFSPNLIAHGRLVTPDIFFTAGFVGSLWAFDRFLQKPCVSRSVLLGLGMGSATLFKFTGLLLFLAFPLLLLLLHSLRKIYGGKGSGDYAYGAKTWLMFVLALASAVLIINTGYLAEGSLMPLEKYAFETDKFRALKATLPAWVPVPFPYHFAKGMDVQLSEEGRYVAYLLGETNYVGFWNYYLVAMLVKTPIPTLALFFLAFTRGLELSEREVLLLFIPGLLFAFFSFMGHKNIGIRYVLFVFPILAIWIGRLVVVREGKHTSPTLRRITVGGCAIWLFLIASASWPDYLPYFNVACGGPRSGHKYLLDSNLDWGQDLVKLREYMEKERIGSIDLAYCGRVPPELYGITYRHVFEGIQQRYLAVSANFLWGRMYFMNGTDYWPRNPEAFAPLRRLEPVAILGHTIYVYDLENLKPARSALPNR